MTSTRSHKTYVQERTSVPHPVVLLIPSQKISRPSSGHKPSLSTAIAKPFLVQNPDQLPTKDLLLHQALKLPSY
jgi:hypothetical protein